MDEEILLSTSYRYPILDESNNEITNPDLNLGYLKEEHFTIHHESIPEKWHYKVISFTFSNGEIYNVTSENDPRVRIIDAKKGVFSYKKAEGEEDLIVVGQTVTTIVDEPMIPAWEETKTFYRYILYTEKELADRAFLANGPQLLAEAQETIDDLLLVLADLLGGSEEE